MKSGRWAWRAGLFAAGLLCGSIALLPMRMALRAVGADAYGLSARGVYGSVWNGRIEALQVEHLPIGTVNASLAPLPLLIGQAHLQFASREASGPTGSLTMGGHSIGGDLDGTIPRLGLAGLPVSVEFHDTGARFTDGICSDAHGRVVVQLSGPFSLLGGVSRLEGPLRCLGETLEASLSGDANAGLLTFRLTGNGRYWIELKVRAADQALGTVLLGAGFVPITGGYRILRSGSIG